jgi:hypothetical protein
MSIISMDRIRLPPPKYLLNLSFSALMGKTSPAPQSKQVKKCFLGLCCRPKAKNRAKWAKGVEQFESQFSQSKVGAITPRGPLKEMCRMKKKSFASAWEKDFIWSAACRLATTTWSLTRLIYIDRARSEQNQKFKKDNILV